MTGEVGMGCLVGEAAHVMNGRPSGLSGVVGGAGRRGSATLLGGAELLPPAGLRGTSVSAGLRGSGITSPGL